jgi:RNA polymerase sigma-70 factor, ECF subfamily
MSVIAAGINQRLEPSIDLDRQRPFRRTGAAPAGLAHRRRAGSGGSPASGSHRSPDPPPAASSDPSSTGADETGDLFLRRLYAQYADLLLAVVLRLTGGDRQRAEDVVQETLLRAWRHADKLRQGEPKSLMPWLATVARRIVINNHWRDWHAQPYGSYESIPAVLAIPDDTERTLQRIVIAEGLAELSAAHRKVIEEIYFHGRTVEEVARMVGVPPGTVKSRTHYAIRVMRAALRRRGVTP